MFLIDRDFMFLMDRDFMDRDFMFRMDRDFMFLMDRDFMFLIDSDFMFLIDRDFMFLKDRDLKLDVPYRNLMYVIITIRFLTDFMDTISFYMMSWLPSLEENFIFFTPHGIIYRTG